MLLLICLEERFGGGWYGSGKEDLVFLGRIGAGSWFPETDIRWSDISCFPDTYVIIVTLLGYTCNQPRGHGS